MSAPARHPALLVLAGAVAALAGCSRQVVEYPAGWPPVVASGHRCPELAGDFALDPAAHRDARLGALSNRPDASPDTRGVTPSLVSIRAGDGRSLDVRFAPAPRPGALPAWQHHVVDIRSARCEDGLLEVDRRDTNGGWTALRLGRDAAGNLVGERLDNHSTPLLRWGDTASLLSGRVTIASWGRWTPTTLPTATATPPAPVAATPPAVTAAPGRPGALPLVDAQAIVLSALPDSALFQGMTPTPTGYRLHLVTQDSRAIEQFTQHLAKDGHFAVRADAPAPPVASGASAPASDVGNISLELVERIVR